IFEWAIDDADVRREWLVDVNWLVNRGTHLADRHYAGNVETTVLSAGCLRHRPCRYETPSALFNAVLSRCRKRDRGTSGRWRQSAAAPCSAISDPLVFSVWPGNSQRRKGWLLS